MSASSTPEKILGGIIRGIPLERYLTGYGWHSVYLSHEFLVEHSYTFIQAREDDALNA